MRLKIGNHEAQRLRNRIASIKLTQKQLADRVNVSERYIREILSTRKPKAIGVGREKIEEILAFLGVGLNHIFDGEEQKSSARHPVLDIYVKNLKSKMYGFLSKDIPETCQNQQMAQYLQEDKAINKAMGFWPTLIVKTIADKYKVIRHFFDENDFFSIIPESGYWRKFRNEATQHKNCYFSFKIVPKAKNSTFRLAYTLESPVNIGSLIPNKIKIIYGKIEQLDDCTWITQYHDTPGSYKIKPATEIIVTIWLDEANHDIIIMSDDDFDLYIDNNDIPEESYKLGVKTKKEVKKLFHQLGTALFPRNHLFHRQGQHDMGDDPLFFWNNTQFLELNLPFYDE